MFMEEIDKTGFKRRIEGYMVGEKTYKDRVTDDNSEYVLRMTEIISRPNSWFTQILKRFVEDYSPEDKPYINDIILGFLEGMKDAAEEAGHLTNREYISRTIKRLYN